MLVESAGLEGLLKLGCGLDLIWGDRGWLEHGMGHLGLQWLQGERKLGWEVMSLGWLLRILKSLRIKRC